MLYSVRPLCSALAVVLIGMVGVREISAESLRSQSFLSKARVGFDEIFNLDYDQALDTFEQLGAQFPAHPGPPLYMATTIWLRELMRRQDLDLDRFITPTYFDRPSAAAMPATDRNRFQELIARAEKLCSALLEDDPEDRDARYFMGAMHGILGSFAITIERSKSQAFKQGKRAYRYHSKLIEEDPNYYDAYMTVGIYEYVVGSLPWYLKFLAALAGYTGSKERGFEYLALAVDRGEFVSDNARTVQLVLLIRERRYEEALVSLSYLKSRFPKNFLIYLNEARLLESLGRRQEAANLYLEVVEKAEKNEPHFDDIPLATFRYTLGEKLLALGRPGAALEHLQESMLNPATPERLRTLSQLASGYSLDLLERRTEALDAYQAVLKQPNFDRSHRHARRHLKKRYTLP